MRYYFLRGLGEVIFRITFRRCECVILSKTCYAISDIGVFISAYLYTGCRKKTCTRIRKFKLAFLNPNQRYLLCRLVLLYSWSPKISWTYTIVKSDNVNNDKQCLDGLVPFYLIQDILLMFSPSSYFKSSPGVSTGPVRLG